MAYTKTTWSTGDVITADKLNHIEDGIAGGYDIVFTITEDGMTADGASFEELFTGAEKNAILIKNIEEKIYLQSYRFAQITAPIPAIPDGCDFGFFDGDLIIEINIKSNGTYEYTSRELSGTTSEALEGTYTYSNGHYVFTESGT